MKLYYKPGACSLASHIALTEAGADFAIEKVDTDAGRTEHGADFRAINPKGYVPALELSDGRVVTEGAAILQFIADRHPATGLAPAAGSFERTRVQEHLNFIAAELHKAFGPFFSGKTLDGDAREVAVAGALKRMAHMDKILSDGRAYLTGDTFTVADSYLFVVANWANFVGIDLAAVPHLKAFVSRVAARPATVTAMRAEGLLH